MSQGPLFFSGSLSNSPVTRCAAHICVCDPCSSSRPIVYLAVSIMTDNDAERGFELYHCRSCNYNLVTVNHDRCLCF